MKELTKAERHEIYKRALEMFEEEWEYLCIVLGKSASSFLSIPFETPYSKNVTPETFPEFFSLKPKHIYCGSVWFNDFHNARQARREVLKKCIEMTK